MTEDRISELLKEYAEPIVAGPVRPAPPRTRRTLRFGLAGAGLVAATVAGFVVVPALASAATLRRVQSAITNAKTMTAAVAQVDAAHPKGRVFSRMWYREGRWRFVAFPGHPLEKTYVLSEGRQFLRDPRHDTLTSEPLGGWWHGKDQSALDFAKAESDLGLISEPRSLEIESRPPLGSRPVYALVMTRPSDSYRCEILVDKATDLPIRSVTSVSYLGETNPQRTVTEYRFNEPVAPELFDPRSFGRPIVDLPREQEALVRGWQRPLAVTPECEVRDVWQNPRGDVFMVYTYQEGSRALPTVLRDGAGTSYLRLQDVPIGGVRGDTSVRETFRFPQRKVGIAVWAPLETPGRLPAELEVGMAYRKPEGGGGLKERKQVRVVSRVRVKVTAGKAPFPPYSTALVLNDYNDQLAGHLADTRATWYQEAGDFENELRWRWEAFRSNLAWNPGGARRNRLSPIIECLRRLGREEEADRVQAEHGKRKPVP